MSPRAGKLLRIAISLGLAAGLLALFLRKLDFTKVGEAIAGAHPGWLAMATGLALLVIPLRSWRWIRLLKRAGTPGFLEANSATAIGFAATTLLPARAGEIVRPVALSRTSGLPFPPVLASIGLERLIDLVTVIVLFVIYALGWAPRMSGEELANFALIRRSAFALGAGTLVGLAVFGLLAARPELADRLLQPLCARLPERWSARVSTIVKSFLAGLGALRTPGEIAVVVVSSAVLWIVICFQIQAAMWAFGLDLPFPVSFFVLTWAVVGLAIPTPGGVGGYHAAVAYALAGFYAVEKNHAAAFALVLHAISFVPVTLVGLLFLATGGLTLRSLEEGGQQGAESKR